MAKHLSKEMYSEASRTGVTFTEILGTVSPSKIESLDAFEFALMERGINPKKGTVEQFYTSTENSILFPEFINRNVRIGLTQSSKKEVVPEDLIATTVFIDSGLYEAVKAEFSEKEVEYKRISEGAKFPSVTISKGDKEIRLVKIGVNLNAPYEALRRMKLPLLATHIQLLGRRLRQTMVAIAVHTLVNGDGNGNQATINQRAMSYATLVEFLLAMSPWESTIWFAKKELIEELLLLPELQGSGLFNTSEGGLAKLLGNPLKKFEWPKTDLGNNQLFQVDKNAALELIKEAGSELAETDKVITRQTEQTSISLVFGMSKIFDEAAIIFEKLVQQ
ncbi:MAG: hypothetical protein JJE30_06045 [Desulfuromonadales bacterium]|nr:hypothetical protein [Desulfuromonadales bacterium]